MIRARFVLVLLAAGVLVGREPTVAQSGDAHMEAKQQAATAAASWLALVDAGDFDESWDEAAALFRRDRTQEEWEAAGRRLKEAVRSLSARTRTMQQYRSSLSQAPAAGPFVLFKYRTPSEAGRFEEFLLVVQDDDTWAVAGYEVAPLPPDSGSRSSARLPRASRP